MKTQTISIFSTKNGVGCSTLAYNLGLLLNQKILEPDSGLLHIFGKTRAFNESGATYYVDKISNVKPSEYKNCVIDAGNHLNRTTLEKVIGSSDVVLVPSFYDHTTLIHTVSSLKIIYSINPHAIIVVVFNRLEPSGASREKEYTKYVWKRMNKFLDNDNIQSIIRQAFVRANFLYFEFLEGGYFFLDHFFATSEGLIKVVGDGETIGEMSAKNARMTDSRIDEDTKRTIKDRLEVGQKNIQHLLRIEQMYTDHANKYSASVSDYEYEFLTQSVSAETAVYSKDALYHNRKLVKDMLELLEKMNVIR